MKLSEIAYVIDGITVGNTDKEITGFVIDSRKVKKGDIFVCLKGARVDGHDYIRQAEQAGASAFLCEHALDTKLPYIKTQSSLEGLQKYAAWYKSRFDILTVAVTGSVGKTTTKEFIYAVLSSKFNTHKTEGNMNSETGLPLTLLGIKEHHEAMVIEMGMSNLGEISILSRLAHPDIAVITNIGVSHIEFLGSQENIMKAKMEILDGLNPSGSLILNGDDKLLKKKRNAFKDVSMYSVGRCDCEYTAHDILLGELSTSFLAVTPIGNIDIEIPVEGFHNVSNALAAIAVGVKVGIPLDMIKKGLLSFKNIPLRQNIYEKDGILVIDDCYNASPSSIMAAIEVLKRKKGRKVVILGDMLELGDFASALHYEVGQKLEGIDLLLCYGNYASSYIEGALNVGLSTTVCFQCGNTEETADKLSELAKKGDCILFKASRGMGAEKVIEKFFERWSS